MINWTGGHISYFIAQIQQLHKKEIFRKILDWVDEIPTTTRMGKVKGTWGAEGVGHISSALIFLVFFYLISSYLGVSIDAVCIYHVLVTNAPFIFTMAVRRVGRAAADAEMHIRSPSDRRGKGRRKGRRAPFDLGTDRPLSSLSFLASE